MKTATTFIAIGLMGVFASLAFVKEVPLKYFVTAFFIVGQFYGVYLVVRERIRSKETSKLITPLLGGLLLMVVLCVYLLFIAPHPAA
jgi:hypothetical protein